MNVLKKGTIVDNKKMTNNLMLFSKFGPFFPKWINNYFFENFYYLVFTILSKVSNKGLTR